MSLMGYSLFLSYLHTPHGQFSHSYIVFLICSYQIVISLYSAPSPMSYANVRTDPTVHFRFDYKTTE